MTLDETHDPEHTSWVESANDPATDFPVQNLPLGVFRQASAERRRIGVAIGDHVLDLDACVRTGLFDALDPGTRSACRSYVLNTLFGLGRADVRRLRRVVSDLLRAGGSASGRAQSMQSEILLPIDACVMTLPAEIGDYTDFYSSLHHALNVGAMMRPDSPLLPNYKWIPIGYHGRASSIVVSGTPIARPRGQTRPDPNAAPTFGLSRALDYELEIGAFIGPGNAIGIPISLSDAHEHVAGLCLVNDWSARDIQAWEYQPLGPFLAKNFATTISPWVVTADALAPFRVPRAPRPADDPAPLPYLDDPADAAGGAFDITLDVSLLTERMRADGRAPSRVSRGSFREMYWTLGQMLTHHASNGCNLRPGDLIASGTVSGASREARGCLLELTMRGKEPITLPGGETRGFLMDGDEVIFRAGCERTGYRRIGFGECRGMVRGAGAE